MGVGGSSFSSMDELNVCEQWQFEQVLGLPQQQNGDPDPNLNNHHGI